MSPITDAVIPVGGLGTRLLPATRSQPKEMLPLVDKPVVQYVVEELVRAGISRLLFVTGRRKRAIEDHFDADPELDIGPLIDPRTGLRILYTRQARPDGFGDALRYAEGFAGDSGVVVAVGDAVMHTSGRVQRRIVPRLIDAYERERADAVFSVAQVSEGDVSKRGIVVLGDAAQVLDVIEKPDPATITSRTAMMGRYVLGPAVFEALRETPPDATGEVQLTDALRRVIAGGGRVVAVPLAEGERRLDVGSVEGYCAAFLQLALADQRHGRALRAVLDAEG